MSYVSDSLQFIAQGIEKNLYAACKARWYTSTYSYMYAANIHT